VPYIPQEQRPPVDQVITALPRLDNPGQLNYVLTEIIIKYLLENEVCYQTINDIKGALDEVACEFRERVIKKFERLKKKVNGDIGYSKVDQTLLDMGVEL
jgi:hypothetical protein